MITIPRSVRFFVGSNPIDMRKSIDGLMSIVQDELAKDPYSGHRFVFLSRRCDRVKILTWDNRQRSFSCTCSCRSTRAGTSSYCGGHDFSRYALDDLSSWTCPLLPELWEELSGFLRTIRCDPPADARGDGGRGRSPPGTS